MTILGSDASYKSGGPQVPLQEETQKTATQLNATRSLLISKDTMNDPVAMQTMINTDEMKRTGHYQSQAPKPTLTPMGYVRLGMPPESPTDESWTDRYKELMLALPNDARARLQAENALPFEQRNYQYTGLDNLMKMAAKLLVFLNSAGEPPAPNSAVADRFEIYSLTPYVLMKFARENGEAMLKAFKRALQDQGRNTPDFDPLEEESDEFSKLLELFAAIVDRVIVGQASAEDLAQMHALAETLQEKISVMQGRDIGGASTAFLPYLKAIFLILDAFSTPLDAAPALKMSLKISQIGMEGSTKGSGLIGLELARVMDQILPKGEKANGITSDMILKALLICIGASSAFLGKNGLGKSPESGTKELEASRFFDVQITLHMLIKTGMLDAFADGVMQAAQIAEQNRLLFRAQLMLAALSAPVLIGSGGNHVKQAVLLSTLERFISPHFQIVMTAKDTGDAQTDESAQAQAVLLQQAWIAFTAGRFEELAAFLGSGMEIISGDSEGIIKDLSAFRDSSDQIAQGIQGGMHERSTNMPDVAIAV